MKTILGLLMMAVSVGAYGQLVKCIGNDGKVEYASQCPPGTKEVKTGIKNVPSAAPAPSQQKSLAESEAEFRKRQMEQQAASNKQAEEAKEAENRKVNCDIARSSLQALESGQRIFKTDPNTGERIYFDDNERARAVTDARRSVDSWCK